MMEKVFRNRKISIKSFCVSSKKRPADYSAGPTMKIVSENYFLIAFRIAF